MISVGGDGTLLTASHWVTGAALLGVNSAPRSSVGYLTLTRRANLARDLARIARGTLLPQPVARIEVEIDGRRLPPALNDVLIAHEQPAATSRYRSAPRPPGGGAAQLRAVGVDGGGLDGGDPLRGRPADAARRAPAPVPRPRALPRAGAAARPWNPASWRPGRSWSSNRPWRRGWLFVDGARMATRFPFGARATFRVAEQPLLLFADPARWAGKDERT